MWLYLMFFASGIPAILYQIVWQRALFALFGINIESVTIVVSAFMLGLGLGSLCGGALSRSKRLSPVALFGVAELGIATFALCSLSLFQFVAEQTRSRPLWVTGTISVVLVVIPTTLMGATLPLLIEHLVRRSQNVGGSVGALYFVNTLGSGAACIVAVRPLMNLLGQTGTVRCAALVNGFIGLSALTYNLRSAHRDSDSEKADVHSGTEETGLMPLPLALLCASFSGFAALSYEIIWYRLMAFAVGDTAPTFATLLGSYLIGIALGSRFAEGYAERHPFDDAIRILPLTILGSAVASFSINPIFAWAVGLRWIVQSPGGILVSLLFTALVCHSAMLFGALFPLIAHSAVGSRGTAGRSVSYLYAANIVGSTLGVLLIGFVLMDKLVLYRIAWLLLISGILCAVLVFFCVTRTKKKALRLVFLVACILPIVIAPASRPLFTTIYDRLLFKTQYPANKFSEVIENRSGVIGVTADSTLYGGGVYDGQFKTDLMNDSNMIVRPFALSAFHPNPAEVLFIGLGSGSWTQVIANNPQLEHMTVVDINRGYVEAIKHHPITASLLRNPKVTIVIDDGRRWLLRHPEATFDVVISNTSFYWRNHSSTLLSADFLRIVRPHLRPKGVFFYNTTYSDDVAATGLAVYPYALRIINCLAVSDSPIVFNRDHWENVLLGYVIDGKRVIDAEDPDQLKKLNKIVSIPEGPLSEAESIESDPEIRHRLGQRKHRIITDDNMGLEWR